MYYGGEEQRGSRERRGREGEGLGCFVGKAG